MADFVVFIQTASSHDIRFVTAVDIATAEAQIATAVQRGIAINGGVREPMRIGIAQLADLRTITPS